MRPEGREGGEVEALITDRYLDALLAVSPRPERVDPSDDPDSAVGAAVRAVSRRLANDLPRFHPSFRFEERLALRLAQVAASMRLPLAAGGESQVVAIRRIPISPDPLGVIGDRDGREGDRELRGPFDPFELARRAGGPENRPLLIGGAVAASAISLAGAWFARRRRPSPMARAIRAAHQIRLPIRPGA